MKKDNVVNENETKQSTLNDMTSMLKLIKMLKSQTTENKHEEPTYQEAPNTPIDSVERVPLSRGAEKLLTLMQQHDERVARIMREQGKDK